MGIKVDFDAWDQVGRELARVDPIRFSAVLELAQRAVACHVDPTSVALPPGTAVPPSEEPSSSD